MSATGQIILLNGAPRSGKSSIARAIQDSFEGVWLNLGVDAQIAGLPERFRPGIGLRPGADLPAIEALVPRLYAALYDSIAAHSRNGINIVADVGHHDGYSKPLNLLHDCARRLKGLPVLFAGVRCPLDVIMARRAASGEGLYLTGTEDDPVPEPVRRWQEEAHRPGVYDVEVNTAFLSADECAARIGAFLKIGMEAPGAFARLAGGRRISVNKQSAISAVKN